MRAAQVAGIILPSAFFELRQRELAVSCTLRSVSRSPFAIRSKAVGLSVLLCVE